MAPKPAKGSGKKTDAAAGNKNWEAALTKELFAEDSWKACVSLVVETCPENETLIQALALAVQKPLRKLFTVLTWDDTQAKIHEFGNPKNKKRDNVPMFSEVTEPAKVLLDTEEEIPCDLLAKLVKFQLLQIKSNDLQRRRAEQGKPVKDKANVVPPSAGKEKGEGKEKKAKNPLSPVLEKKTKLKRRDDIEPPNYIDDEPDDGPQHYILLLGFYQPHLLGALDSIGIQVANVIKLLHQTKGQHKTEHNKENENTSASKDDKDAELEDDCTKKVAAQTQKLDHFWSGLRPHLDSGPPNSKLHDVAELSFTVHIPSVNQQDPEAMLTFGSSIFEGIACLIYDSLDWRRQHQHYLDNIKIINVPNLSVLNAHPAEPVASTPLPRFKKKLVQEGIAQTQETKVPSTDVDMCYYNKLLDMVPPEACSVPLMLHCMLEQVVFSSDQSVPVPPDVAEEPRAYDGPCLDQELASCMPQSFIPVVHSEKDKSHLVNSLLTMIHSKEHKKRLLEKFGREEKKSGEPLVVRHHDHRAQRLRNTHAVEGFDPAEVEINMLKMSPVCDLIQSVAQQRNSFCWMAIKQQLQYHCTNDVVSWPEVEHLFHRSVFESMPLTKLDYKGVLQKAAEPLDSLESAQQSAVPWDDPVSFAKQQLWNLQNQGPTFLTDDRGNTEVNEEVCIHLELSDIQSCRLRSLFDWHHTEHHNATTFPQVLHLASEEYSCLDTFRGSTKNILYVYCHNPMSHRRQCRESWDVALHTTIKFRKYLENVADKISDWTKEEESKREAMKRPPNVKTPNVEDIAADPAEKEPGLEPVIRKESLKAWKMEQERLKEEELAKKTKKDNTPKGRQEKEDTPAKDDKKVQNKASQSAKKGRADTACSSAKTRKGSINTKADENKEPDKTEEQFNGFLGYDMDGKLIHVSGNLQHLYPSDGGCIAVETARYVEGSSLMKVAVRKDGHHFYTHVNYNLEEASGPPLQSKLKEQHKEENKVSTGITKVKQGSLTAVLDNGIRLSYSFYGSTGQYIENLQETLRQSPDASTLNLGTQETPADLLNHEPPCPSNPTGPLQSQVCEGQLVPSSCPFNSLNLSVPNGLLLQFLREERQGVPPEEQGVLVRQSFPFHGKGDVGQIPDPYLSKELSRLVTCQGAVVRSMRDGATQVLFADGAVSFSQDSGAVWVPVSGKENTTQVTGDDTKEHITENNGETERGCWLTTTPSGARICTVGTTHKCIPTPPLLVFKATDPMTHEVMLTREDGVISVQNPNGSISVEHADGTRITSLYEDTRPLHRGERSERETLKSSSAECVCGCTECICVTHCAESLVENSGDEINNNNTIHTQSAYLEVGHVDKKTTVFKNGEESVAASRKSSKSENENMSTKERVVLVEKEGCATVVMYPERQTAHIFLADGTIITGNNKGAYQVFPSSAGLLQIRSDGQCVYSSDPLETPCPKGGFPISPAGSYTMSHSDNVVCDVTDPDGNHFEVMEDGTISVLNLSPAPSIRVEKVHEDEEDRDSRSVVKHSEHSPRLFIVHENGSGTELLHSQIVEELLFQAYSDPTIAIIKDPLPETQDEFGITILKPCHESVWSQWLLAKQKPDITPPNLRNRSWHDFPREENRTPGPPFGTDLGRSLTLHPRSGGCVTQRPPVRSCPKVLEMRELHQHRPFTTLQKNTLDKQLKEYIESLMKREQRSEQMKIRDPRSERESVHASALLNLVLSFAEEDDNTEKRTCDIRSLYIQGAGAPLESDSSDDTTTAASESFATGKDSKWTERLAQYRRELCEEKACREALKKKTVVPYFHLENISLYESLLHQQITNSNSPVPPVSHHAEPQDTPEKAKLLHLPRPLNPKPSPPARHTARRVAAKGPPEEKSISITQTAAESSLKASSVQSKAVHVDVTGNPRNAKVRLSACITTSKPSSVPNHQFLSVEEPVRRKCHTTSLKNPKFIMRGFHLHPPRVDFGTVQEGTTSAVTVVMKNVGIDTCRFNVKQPPPSTGLRVVYNPGPVAAGLNVELQVQLLAMCAVQAGEAETKRSLSQDITIHTETEILYLPVTANILCTTKALFTSVLIK